MQCVPVSADVADPPTHHPERLRVKREPLERFEELSPESRVQNLALTHLHVPCSLDSGTFPKPHSPNLDLPAEIFDLILNGGGAHLHRHHTAYIPHPKPLLRKEAGRYLGEDFLGEGHGADVVDPPARHPEPLDAPPLLQWEC